MNNSWNGSDSDSDTETDTSAIVKGGDIPPKELDGEFCRCIQTLKWNLYQTIVLSPALNTSTAQQNDLIQTYVKQLGRLYLVLDNALKGRIIDAEMRPFPVKLRHDILKCSQWIHRVVRPLTPTDLVPYRDYVNTALRVYPFVHHMRMLGGADDVEAL